MKQLLFILVIAFFQISSSQQCAYDHLIQKKKNQEIFMKNYNSIYNYANSRISANNQTYYIPVVFHIVWNQESQNLPDYVIDSQIDVLNEDYRKSFEVDSSSENDRNKFLDNVFTTLEEIGKLQSLEEINPQEIFV